MLPPVLEIHIIWHPSDTDGCALAEKIIDHYHGDHFSGLIGGAVEVCLRSTGWNGPSSAPRPIALPSMAGPPQPAAFVAVLVLLGDGLARAVSDHPAGPWRAYLEELKANAARDPEHIRVVSAVVDKDAAAHPVLKGLFGADQFVGLKDPLHPEDPTLFLRDLSQALAKFLAGNQEQLQVFISHAKHMDPGTEASTTAFIEAVRQEVSHTRLAQFFDSNSIQADERWAEVLEQNAATGALLALRTDRYASREWCQREVAIAKTHGVPVVILDALLNGENRGSFLLDHAPRLPTRRAGDGWERDTIRQALALLVDECLKRVLWKRQEQLAGENAGVAWWAPHAPEPLTLIAWLAQRYVNPNGPMVVLHPDPPLTPCEREILDTMARLTQLGNRLEVMTPRTFAARGGGATP